MSQADGQWTVWTRLAIGAYDGLSLPLSRRVGMAFSARGLKSEGAIDGGSGDGDSMIRSPMAEVVPDIVGLVVGHVTTRTPDRVVLWSSTMSLSFF